MTPTSTSGRLQRGTVLMLMPAAVLIVVLLGSIALDFGAVHLRQRELDNIAAAAADDAVTYGIDEADLRMSAGELVLRPDRVEAALRDALARRGLDGVELVAFCIDDGPRPGVAVQLGFVTEYFMARALPGASTSITLRSTQRASLQGDRLGPNASSCAL